MPGTYLIDFELKDMQGVIHDRGGSTFTMGFAEALVTNVTVAGQQPFGLGDVVPIAAEFENRGDTVLDGLFVLRIEDWAGNLLAEFRQAFSNLTVGSTYFFSTTWTNLDVLRGNCQFTGYVVYDGKSAPEVDLASEPCPVWVDGIQMEAAQRKLHWPSVPNRSYAVEFSSNLLSGAFEPIVGGLSAQPPMNVYTDAVPRTGGFYRVREFE